MVIKCTGKLVFQPPNVSKKHNNQNWKKVAMIILDCSMDRYYAWFLKKRFNLDFNKPLRGPHVTIISDKMDDYTFKEASKLFNNKNINFYYELEPRTNSKHWWLRVYCPEGENIREALGLKREPYFGFHLTIGYMNDLSLSHSEYIYDAVKKFDLISSTPRKDLSKHTINIPECINSSNIRASDEFVINGKTVYYKDGHYTDIKNKVS